MMQHSAYQPLLPTGNKYLQQKWDKDSYDMHRRKVKSAKATINTTPPRTFCHLALRMKKQQLEEEQMTKIKRENDMLLEKISHIMRTTGRIDNRNDYESKSLGGERRQQELLRITKENQLILFRLSQCRPHYRVSDWDEGWLKTLKVMDSIARYPRGVASGQRGQGRPGKTSSGCDTTKESSVDATGQSSDSSITNGKEQQEEEEEQQEETTRQEEAGTHPAPSPDAPETSTSSDTPERSTTPDPTAHTPNTSSSDTPDPTAHTPNTSSSDTPHPTAHTPNTSSSDTPEKSTTPDPTAHKPNTSSDTPEKSPTPDPTAHTHKDPDSSSSSDTSEKSATPHPTAHTHKGPDSDSSSDTSEKSATPDPTAHTHKDPDSSSSSDTSERPNSPQHTSHEYA